MVIARNRILIEYAAVLAILCAVSFYIFDPATALVSSLLGAMMLAIAVSDIQNFIIPDSLSLPAIPAGLIINSYLGHADGFYVEAVDHLTATALALGLFLSVRYGYKIWRGREGLGLGDVKLAMVAGAWTGIDGLTPTIMTACLMALLVTFLKSLWQSTSLEAKTAIPFGAFLAPSIWLIWTIQQLGLPLTIIPNF